MSPSAKPPGRNPAGDPNPPGKEDPSRLVMSEEWLLAFLDKYRGVLIGLCLAAGLAVLARYGWDTFQREHLQSTEQAFAAALTPEEQQVFISDHPRDVLAQVAQLRLADAAYAAGHFTEARDRYGQVIQSQLPAPVASRTQLGLAMAEIESGDREAGREALRLLANDPKQFLAVRAEAVYQLASLAASSGDRTEVQKLSEQLLQIDPNSPWTERIFQLEAESSPSSQPSISLTPNP